jgi:AcrR family transcriptional regulator
MADAPARANQRLRTRKDLLRAAARLMTSGAAPTLEEVAAEAMVSRATAYRYFPSAEALLAEAAVDVVFPEPEEVFDGAMKEPTARLLAADRAMHELIVANETALRMMLMHSMQLSIRGETGEKAAARQNRRTQLIEAALAPCRGDFEPEQYRKLVSALAFILGTEAMLVTKDVLELDEAAAGEVRRWAIGAMVDAARKGRH